MFFLFSDASASDSLALLTVLMVLLINSSVLLVCCGGGVGLQWGHSLIDADIFLAHDGHTQKFMAVILGLYFLTFLKGTTLFLHFKCYTIKNTFDGGKHNAGLCTYVPQ